MREILFRGKDKNDGTWFEGFFVKQGDDAYLFTEGQVNRGIGTNGWLNCCQMYSVIPETIEQYTGLKDKNGQRIFEGDVVRWTSENTYLTSNYVYDRRAYGYGSVLIVTALKSGFTLRPIKDNAPDIPNANCKLDNYTFWNHHNQLEVIGNIHDNPELLKEG